MILNKTTGKNLTPQEFATATAEKIRKRLADDIIATGRDLESVKSRLDHGEFANWLKFEFDWSIKTAERMMSVARQFGKNDNLSNLTIQKTALYLLAAPSTPDEVRQEAVERAQNGERITHATAKRLVDDARGKRGQTPAKAETTESRDPLEEALNFGCRLGELATIVLDQGAPVLVEAVRAGHIPLDTAASLAAGKTKEEQATILEASRTDEGKISVGKVNRAIVKGTGEATPEQRHRAIAAQYAATNFLKRSSLVFLGRDNPCRKEAFDGVIRWLKDSYADKL